MDSHARRRVDEVELSYGVGGHLAGGFEKIARAVDAVLADQLKRFETFVETGKAAGRQNSVR